MQICMVIIPIKDTQAHLALHVKCYSVMPSAAGGASIVAKWIMLPLLPILECPVCVQLLHTSSLVSS